MSVIRSPFSSRKTQISVEFIVILFTVILLFSIGLLIYQNKNKQMNAFKEDIEAKDILHKIALGIQDAYLGGNGTTFYYVLPEKIYGMYEYELGSHAEDHILYITWNDNYYSYPLITSSVSIASSLSEDITIQNRVGVVYVE